MAKQDRTSTTVWYLRWVDARSRRDVSGIEAALRAALTDSTLDTMIVAHERRAALAGLGFVEPTRGQFRARLDGEGE
jgi:hypothetical protein